MCLAVPGKIISIDESTPGLRMAKVSFAGITKDICIQWIPDAYAGDYVIAHAGMALSRVDEDEAEASLNTFQEWTEGLDNQESLEQLN